MTPDELDAMVEKTRPWLERYAVTALMDCSDAEDVASDVVQEAHLFVREDSKKYAKFTPVQVLRYLKNAIRSKASDNSRSAYNKLERHTPIVDEDGDGYDTGLFHLDEEIVDHSESIDAVIDFKKAIARLGEIDQIIAKEHVMDGEPFRDIELRHGIPKSTVARRWTRIIRPKLQDWLEAYGADVLGEGWEGLDCA